MLSKPLFEPFCKKEIYVGDLNPIMQEADIFNWFSCFGTITDFRVGEDRQTPSGLNATITYSSIEEARAAVINTNHRFIWNYEARATFRTFKKEDGSNRKEEDYPHEEGKIYVDNIKLSYDPVIIEGDGFREFYHYSNDAYLHEHFSQYGMIYRTRINRCLNGNYKLKNGLASAVIQFYDKESAKKVMEDARNIKPFNGKKLFVSSNHFGVPPLKSCLIPKHKNIDQQIEIKKAAHCLGLSNF